MSLSNEKASMHLNRVYCIYSKLNTLFPTTNTTLLINSLIDKYKKLPLSEDRVYELGTQVMQLLYNGTKWKLGRNEKAREYYTFLFNQNFELPPAAVEPSASRISFKK